MRVNHRRARVNVKALVILGLVIGALGVLAFGGHHIRKRVMARNALEEGQAHFKAKEWSEACTHLKRYLQQYPDNVAVLEQYARAQLAVRPRTAENISTAAGAYERLLRHRPGDDVLSDEVAKLLVRIGDHESAMYYCDKRLEVDPTDASATVMKARVLLSRSRSDEAAAILKPLVEQHPDAAKAYPMLARTALATDDSDTALTNALGWLDTGVRNNPESPDVLVARAVFHLDEFSGRKARDAQQARADLEAAEALHPAGPALTLRMAQAWVALGDLDRTRALIARLDAFDDDSFYADDLIPEEVRLGRHRVAAGLYRQMNDRDRMSALADSALAELTEGFRTAFLPTAVELYALSDHVEEARRYLEDYRSAVDKLTRGGTAMNEGLEVLRARVAWVDHRPYDVINILKPVVDWNPRNTTAWRLLADAYDKTGQDSLALDALQQASTRQEGDLALETQMARAYFRRGDWSAALRTAQICERLAPDDLDIRLLRIEAALRRELSRPVDSRDVSRLIEELTALQKQHPDLAAIRILPAMAAERQGRYADAESMLRAALTECSDSLTVTMHLAGFLERRHRTADALKLYRQATERDGKDPAPWRALARLQESGGQHEAAQATLVAAADSVEGIPQRRDVLRTLARLRLVRFDRSDAVASLVALASEDPADVETRLLLLEIPEVLNVAETAQKYIDDVKAVQGERGLDWRFCQARLWLRSENWQSHVDEIDSALTFCILQKPRWWTRAVVARAVMYERLGNDVRAEEICRDALTTAPGATAVAERLLSLLQRQRRFSEAKTVLDQFDKVNLSSPALGAYRLGVAIGVGEYDEAIEELETRVAADPQAAAERVILARLLYKQRRDVAGAFKLLDEAESGGGTLPVGSPLNVAGAVAARAAILIAEQRFQEAEKVLDDNVARHGDFAAYLLRAEFHAGRGVNDLAERDFRHLTTFEDSRAAGYHLLGRFYMKTGSTDRAIEAWEKGLQADPHRTSLKQRLMQVLIASDDAAQQQRGRDLLAELLKELPSDSALLGFHASLLVHEGTPEARAAAREELERVIALDKHAIAAHLALIDMDFARGRIDDAVAAAQRASEDNPDAPAIMLALARLESERGNESLGRDYARSAMKADPSSIAAYVFLIDAAVARGDASRAEELLTTAESKVPGHWLLEFKRAELLNAAGKVDDAIERLESLAQREDVTDAGRVALTLAGLYCKKRDDEKFDFYITRAQRDSAVEPAAARLRMQCMLAQGRADAIAAFLSKHQAERPNDVETILRGASLLLTTGVERHHRQALEFFEQVATTVPDSVPAHLGAAKAAYLLGDTDAVIRGYRGALAADPENQRALNDLAWVLAETGRPAALDEALKLASRGVGLYPTDPHLLDTRGVIHVTRGGDEDLAAAVDDFLSAVELTQSPGQETTRARALVHLADAYLKQGDTDRGRKRLEEARALQDQHGVLNDKEQAKLKELLDRCVR